MQQAYHILFRYPATNDEGSLRGHTPPPGVCHRRFRDVLQITLGAIMYKVMGRNVILLNYNGALFKNAVCIGRVIDRFLPN